MRRYFIFILTILPMLAGCTATNIENNSFGDFTIKTFSQEVSINDYFNDYYDMCQNGLLMSLEDRFKKCNISQESISGLPTEDLIKLFIDYPLNYLILVYNNPQDAVSIVVDNSEIHKELLRRDNTADIILQFYKESEIDLKNIKRVGDSYKRIPYSATLFLEYFLASKHATQILSNSIEEIREILNTKYQERLERSDLFSYNSIQPLLEIDESLSRMSHDNSATISRSGAFLGYTTIYTPLNHQALEGNVYDELSGDEIAYIDAVIASEYSNAYMISSSSVKYNCHSYAWHNQSISNTVWLNRINSSGVFQLQKYWINDLYCEYENLSGSDIVYYADGDHSGVIQNNNLIVSKWGRGPLMRHNINYCPYLLSGRRYFIKMGYPYSGTASPEGRLNIVGDNNVLINTWHEYHLDNYKQGRVYQWTFTDLANPCNSSNITYVCNSTDQGMSYSIKCGAYGAFQIRVDEYINGINTAFGQKYVISVGSL